MARTIAQIREDILTEKRNNPSLDVLVDTNETDASRTAIWKLWVYVIAYAVWVHENLWDIFRADIDSLLEQRNFAGTPAWYERQAKAFQLDDPVVVDPITYNISYDNTGLNESQIAEKQIIKRIAFRRDFTSLSIIKAAKESSDLGRAEKLTSAERQQFESYIRLVQFAGAQIVVQSEEPDLLALQANIYYDGFLKLADVKASIEGAANDQVGAITQYLSSIADDGVFNRNHLIDSIQQAGVDIEILSMKAAPFGENYPDAELSFTYRTTSGYINLDLGNNTIINYIPR
ncbi:MAG: hypothetical protein ACPGJS_05490 [Flammeovirgaceae bacterium]